MSMTISELNALIHSLSDLEIACFVIGGLFAVVFFFLLSVYLAVLEVRGRATKALNRLNEIQHDLLNLKLELEKFSGEVDGLYREQGRRGKR